MWAHKYEIGDSVEYLTARGVWSDQWVITAIDLTDWTYSLVHVTSGDHVDDVLESDIQKKEDTITIPRSLLVECEDMVKLAYDSANTAFRAAVTPEQVVYAFELHDRIMTAESRIRDALTRGDTR